MYCIEEANIALLPLSHFDTGGGGAPPDIGGIPAPVLPAPVAPPAGIMGPPGFTPVPGAGIMGPPGFAPVPGAGIMGPPGFGLAPVAPPAGIIGPPGFIIIIESFAEALQRQL